MKGSRGGLGLRARLTASLAVAALALSVLLSVLTYGLTRTYLLRQRETSARRQAYLNATIVRDGLRAADPDVPRVLDALITSASSDSILVWRDQEFATSLQLGPESLPPTFLHTVSGADVAVQRFPAAGLPRFAVGIAMPAVDAVYVEVFSLQELQNTLATLSRILFVVTVATALAGAAVGRWVSRRILRPVSETASAAAAIAAGELSTRLASDPDPDLSRLAASFNDMADALQRRIERDARFASSVSHELRSPLTALLTALEVAEARVPEMPVRAGTAVGLLGKEIRRFDRMVRDLLEMSRAETVTEEIERDVVDMTELLREAVRAFGSDVPVDVERGPGAAEVQTSKRRLERIIVNLLENAARYAGGATRLTAQVGGDRIRIAVEDRGPGVDPAERTRIFEPFFRGKEAGHRGRGGGTGLGLTLVAEHAHVLGGRAWVEDNEGGGARFVVEFPR